MDIEEAPKITGSAAVGLASPWSEHHSSLTPPPTPSEPNNAALQSIPVLSIGSREILSLQESILAFLACIVEQTESPLTQDLSLKASQDTTSTDAEIHINTADTWNFARRRLDKISRSFSKWTKDFNSCSTSHDNKDGSVVLVMDGVFNLMRTIAHRLIYMVNIEGPGSQGVDKILLSVTGSLKEISGGFDKQDEKSYNDCPRCNKISIIPSASAVAVTPEPDYLDLLAGLIADLQGYSKSLKLALRIKGWRKEAVEGSKSVSRQLAISERDNEEPYHKSRTDKSTIRPSPNIERSPTHKINPSHAYINPAVKRPRSLGLSDSSRLLERDNTNRGSQKKNTSLSNESEKMIDIDETVTYIKEQWQEARESVNSIEIPPSSRIALILSTDKSIFNLSNIHLELEKLEKNTNISDESSSGDIEEILPQRIEDLKLNLAGDDLPKDIVTLLVDAVPIDKDEFSSFSTAFWYTQPLAKLYAARSLLEGLPNWKVHLRDAYLGLIEPIFNQVQRDLVDLVISSFSDISTKLLTRINRGDAGLHLRLPIRTMEKAALQLLEHQYLERLVHSWPGLDYLLILLAIKCTALSQHLELTSGVSIGLTKENRLQDICLIPSVHFLIHMVEEGDPLSRPKDYSALGNTFYEKTVGDLLHHPTL